MIHLARLFFQSLAGRPLFDRVFYVPYWECPYHCDFCCVDSMPGQAPRWPDEAEAAFMHFAEASYKEHRKPLQIHYYGGEPLLRPDYLLHFVRKIAGQPFFFRFYLYSTLIPADPGFLTDELGEENIRFIVNPETATPVVEERMKKLGKTAMYYKNPVFFPTGRGSKTYPEHRNLLNSIPIGLPGRSCFAATSGPLFDAAHRRINLCCLPQSPVVGSFSESPQKLLKKYKELLATYPAKANETARKNGYAHPCSVCEKETDFQSTFRMEPQKAVIKAEY